MERVYKLDLDPAINVLSNLLLAGIFVTQNVLPGVNLKISLPMSVFNAVSKVEFNRYFSDVLIDSGFRDENLEIAVLPEESFIFRVV